jgi:ADP-ribosyl-[dinitrogen reductase] hydrolase
MKILKTFENYTETYLAIEKAIQMYETSEPTFENIEKLGGGWIGEEALAISIYCSLCYQHDFGKGIILAINHSGDTDSTGAITGNILGLLLGEQAILPRWLVKLEMKEFISQIGKDLYIECPVGTLEFDEDWR